MNGDILDNFPASDKILIEGMNNNRRDNAFRNSVDSDNTQLIEYLKKTSAMSSGDASSDNKKYIVLAGVGIIMIFTIIMIS
jgi:hypothetical protein